MPETLSVNSFLDKLESERLLLIDTRSEKEFEHARIPGAVNIPLLNNVHRHQIGIEYKTNGREAAVMLGFKLVGPHFHEFIEQSNDLSAKKEVMIYCWRGGMRSSIMSWVLSMAGFKTTLLKGGYKSFRSLILSTLTNKKRIVVVGGQTCVGKTELLIELDKKGEQVIDLEHLANHKGSAFGNLGLPPQPSNEHFENMLGMKWRKLIDDKIVWMESESHSIGRVKIPDAIFNQLQSAPMIDLVRSKKIRQERIINEYYCFSKYELAECTKKIGKRLGNLRLTQALMALVMDRKEDWLDIVMEYYDKTYKHSLGERNSLKRIPMLMKDEEQFEGAAERIIEIAGREIANITA